MREPAARERVANGLARSTSHGRAMRTMLFAGCLVASLNAPAAADDANKLSAIFEEYWANRKVESPEFATFVGDDRHARGDVSRDRNSRKSKRSAPR